MLPVSSWGPSMLCARWENIAVRRKVLLMLPTRPRLSQGLDKETAHSVVGRGRWPLWPSYRALMEAPPRVLDPDSGTEERKERPGRVRHGGGAGCPVDGAQDGHERALIVSAAVRWRHPAAPGQAQQLNDAIGRREWQRPTEGEVGEPTG